MRIEQDNELEELENSYRDSGKKALLLATGPSVNVYRDIFQHIPDDYVVFCIKSAIDAVPQGRCDFHLINNLKLKKYKYRIRKPFVVYASAGKKDHKPADLRIKLKGPSIARCKAYDQILKFGLVKKWGPGIMYDLALPFVHFLGFEHVFICGWDLFPLGQASNLHFDGRYGHNKTRKPCKFEGKWVNESDLINLMSGHVYDACVNGGFRMHILTQGDLCHISPKVPRMFAPTFGFDPYVHLLKYHERLEYTLDSAWHDPMRDSDAVQTLDEVFYLHYVSSYQDLTNIVLDNVKDYDHKDYKLILDDIVQIAKDHYETLGKVEILTGSRPVQVFEPWCYMASYKEMKRDYWDLYDNTLNVKTLLYTWITVGYPLCLSTNKYDLTTREAMKIMFMQTI